MVQIKHLADINLTKNGLNYFFSEAWDKVLGISSLKIFEWK